MSDASTRAPASTLWPSFGARVLLGMAAGVLLGLAARALPGGDAGWLAQTLHTVGQSFVQLLKALVPPLVFTAIVGSVAALRDLDNAAKLVAQTLLWFAATALIAVLIGIALGIAIQPGIHAGVDRAAATLPSTTGSWLDFLKGLIPVNVLGLTAATSQADAHLSTTLWFNVLQIIVVAIAVGAAAVRIGAAGEPFLAFNASALAIFRRLLRWVIALTPIGTAGLIGDAAVRYGWGALSALGAFTGAIYLGLVLVMLVVYPLILLAHGLSPVRFFASAWPAIQLGFVSRSSVGTLPLTEEVTERALGVPRLRRLCGAARRHDQDGRLRGGLSGGVGDLCCAVLRRGTARDRLSADRLRLRVRIGRHRRADGRDSHADADAVDLGPAA